MARSSLLNLRGDGASRRNEGVTNIPRVKELQAITVEAQYQFTERDAVHTDALEDLLSIEIGEIEPLF